MIVTEAKFEDIEAVLSLLDQLLICVRIKGGHPSPSSSNREQQKELFKELLLRKDVKIFVVKNGEEIVGVADVFIVPLIRRGYYQAKVEDLVVTEKMRGKGIGSKLFQHIVDYCKQENIKVIKLTTAIEFEESQKFYEKLGGKFTEKMYRFDL